MCYIIVCCSHLFSPLKQMQLPVLRSCGRNFIYYNGYSSYKSCLRMLRVTSISCLPRYLIFTWFSRCQQLFSAFNFIMFDCSVYIGVKHIYSTKCETLINRATPYRATPYIKISVNNIFFHWKDYFDIIDMFWLTISAKDAAHILQTHMSQNYF